MDMGSVSNWLNLVKRKLVATRKNKFIKLFNTNLKIVNEEFLDSDINKMKVQNAKYSFYLGLTSFLILAIMTLFSYLRINDMINISLNSVIQNILFLVLLVSSITGIQYSIKSIRKKEPNSLQKLIGAILNSVLLILFIYLLATVILELNKFF